MKNLQKEKQNPFNPFSSIKDNNLHTWKHQTYMFKEIVKHKVKRTSKTVLSYFKWDGWAKPTPTNPG